MQTYIYKMTSDRGGAPCAPQPVPGAAPLLTLAICKPAIRRTAQPGDRILGLTSRSLSLSEGYPLHSVIYAAVVDHALEAREYYAPLSPFRSRPDCIYKLRAHLGEFQHTGTSRLHRGTSHFARDLGRSPLYRNGRILFCRDFRYFGVYAVPIPQRLFLLSEISRALGQGHRVFTAGCNAAIDHEFKVLFKALNRLSTRFTPLHVQGDAYERPLSDSSISKMRERRRRL